MSIAKFKPTSHNANRHTVRGLKALTDSMRAVGYTEPMVAAADGEMLSGSARLETVADVFGVDVEPLVIHSDGRRPVIHIRDDIPNAQTPEAVKIALTANRVAQLDLSWDVEMLASLDADAIEGLWTPLELSDLGQQWADEHAEPIADDPGPQIDKAEELQAKWQVRLGDMFALGAHRLICGDCTDAATVARVMDGEKAALVVTDPPYGIGADKKNAHSSIRDNPAWSNSDWDHAPSAEQVKYISSFCDRVAIWGGNYFANLLPVSSGWLAWIKPQFGTGFSLSDMELCWTNQAIGPRCKEFGRRDGHDHPTQKPVDLLAWTIEKLGCADGAIVIDFYAGSGTTGVACERLGRKARMIEIAPAYCSVILERLSGLGLTPVKL
jgi:hypothetical protein